MTTYECEDCAFDTDDAALAEDHTRKTDHSVKESEEADCSPEAEVVMAKCNLDEEEYDRLHETLCNLIKEFGTEAIDEVYKLAQADTYAAM